MKAILTALCAVQKDLAQAGIAKNDTNTFDKYKFRGIDAVLNALAPILSKHGVIIMPSVTSSEIRQVTSSQGKPQQHAKVTVDYTLYCEQGESITHSFVGEGMDRGDKAINKACTAAYKYFLFEAFCIPVEGTPDADTDSPEVGDVETPEMIEVTKEQKDTFLALLGKKDGWGLKRFANDVGPEILTELFNSAPQGQKTAFKNVYRELVGGANEQLKATLAAIQDAIDEQSPSAYEEIMDECTDIEKHFVLAGITEVQAVQLRNMGVEI